MIEKIGAVKNPLSIIAIFAGIAEISGTTVLPFLAQANQATFIWFLMLFPTILVLAFFAILFAKPSALYAPSDYRDEANFIRLLRPASAEERKNKIDMESIEVAEAEVRAESKGVSSDQSDVIETSGSPDFPGQNNLSPEAALQRRNNVLLAESIAFQELQREFSPPIARDIKLGPYLVDGLILSRPESTLIEVKYAPLGVDYKYIVFRAMDKLMSAGAYLPPDFKEFNILLVFVVPVAHDSDASKDAVNALAELKSYYNVSARIRFIPLRESSK